MNLVRNIRAAGIEAYYTMDAGPNIKVLCRLSEAEQIVDQLKSFFSQDQLIISGPGPAPIKLEEESDNG